MSKLESHCEQLRKAFRQKQELIKTTKDPAKRAVLREQIRILEEQWRKECNKKRRPHL
jgi:hypothetical protein